MSRFASRAQLACFIAVGLTATATHTGVALVTQRFLGVQPLVANLLGYALATGVSYIGNARLTFRRPILLAGQFLRFMVISLSALALNEGLVFVFVNLLHAPFFMALVPVVLVVPLLTYTMSRVWGFVEHVAPEVRLAEASLDDGA